MVTKDSPIQELGGYQEAQSVGVQRLGSLEGSFLPRPLHREQGMSLYEVLILLPAIDSLAHYFPFLSGLLDCPTHAFFLLCEK